MISKKLLILQRLTAHLEAIQFTSELTGAVDLSGVVFRGRYIFGDDAPETFIAITEPKLQELPLFGGEGKINRKDDWRILLQGFVPKVSSNNPLDPAYELLAHVEQRMARLVAEDDKGSRNGLYPEEYRLGRTLEGILFHNPIVREPDVDVSDTAYFYMPVTLQIATDMKSPFLEED